VSIDAGSIIPLVDGHQVAPKYLLKEDLPYGGKNENMAGRIKKWRESQREFLYQGYEV
jgi:hypothetical protein